MARASTPTNSPLPSGSVRLARATEAREDHTATLLPDGRVLIVGGKDGVGGERKSAEVWDPETASFGPAGSLAERRDRHTATPLPDGRVLIVGGTDTGAAEVWSP